MHRSTSCWISARSSSSFWMEDHGDLNHILAIGQTTPRGKATSEVELTSVSSASGSACSSGFSMCRRKCRRSELYAEREDSRVRGHEAVSTLSKSRKAFQQAERRPLLGAEMWPSRRTASLSSASDGYCWSSCQLSLASARRRMAAESLRSFWYCSVMWCCCRYARNSGSEVGVYWPGAACLQVEGGVGLSRRRLMASALTQLELGGLVQPSSPLVIWTISPTLVLGKTKTKHGLAIPVCQSHRGSEDLPSNAA